MDEPEVINNKNNEENSAPNQNFDEDKFLKPMEPPPQPPPSISSSKPLVSNVKQQKALSAPPPINYEKPEWSAEPPSTLGDNVLDPDGYCEHFFLEVIKNGSVVERIKLNKSMITLGRFEDVDILAEHPTISRYHVVFQYSNGLIDSNYPEGYYLFDLGSTHGTFLNKTRVHPNKYTFISLDSILKFGQSTRLYVLHGPKAKYSSDDLKINLTHEQMKKVKEKHSQLQLRLKIRKEVEEEERLERMKQEESSIDWGMNEQASKEDEKEEGDEEDAKSDQVDESYFSADPKKALKIYFEREGHELSYDIEELGPGKYRCRIDLPITNDYGESIFAEVVHEGKKKDSMVVCAMEACRMLNAEGVLKQSSHESAKKKREKDWESNDFYDSDDDSYYDRTGDIEKKRQQRMANAGKLEQTATMLTKQKNVSITFEMILKDMKMILEEENDIESKLDKCKKIVKAVSDDDIDAYINSLKTTESSIDALTRAKMKKRLAEVKNEMIRLEKLCKVAKPKEFDLNKWVEELKRGFNAQQPPSKSDEDSSKKLNKEETTKPLVSIEKSNLNIETNISSSTDVKKGYKEDSSTSIVKNSEKNNKEDSLNIQKGVEKKHSEEYEMPASIIKKRKITENRPAEIVSYDQLNPDDYAIWQPPEGQSGDGKTSLNDKYGY